MSEIEMLPCPSCGEPVQTSGGPVSMIRDSEAQVHSFATESVTCPACECRLQREILPGAPWRLAGGAPPPLAS